MSPLVAVPLPDGRWLALAPETLREGLAAAKSLGLDSAADTSSHTAAAATDPLLNSEELARIIGVHSTTLEGMAKSGAIPSIRVGKALRFEPAAVKERLRAKAP